MESIAHQPIRVYADTSVYGGVFDEEFATPSRAFFEQVRSGRYRLVMCRLLRDELEDAPSQVRQWYEQFEAISERVAVSESAVLLQQAYLSRNRGPHVGSRCPARCGRYGEPMPPARQLELPARRQLPQDSALQWRESEPRLRDHRHSFAAGGNRT
jgi:hypothetical protein